MTWQGSKRYAEVNGRRMAYVERGQGSPIVLLHGNPTSSYVWRSVLPQLEDLGRCIAPDLIGMGDSDKLPADDQRRYTFIRHREFLDALLDQLGVTHDVTLVLHDWGSALGFDWARRHPDRVRAIAYMEAFVTPLSWEDYDPRRRDVFERLRSPGGENLVLDQNFFVNVHMPSGILRTLSSEELAAYVEPFASPGEARRPTLTWAREVPIDGNPPEVDGIVGSYSRWLAQSVVPKLFINADPGALLTGRPRELCRTWPHQTEVTVAGKHFVQEDSPDQIGQAIRRFLEDNRPQAN
jgi:haloalkane dehalogenase